MVKNKNVHELQDCGYVLLLKNKFGVLVKQVFSNQYMNRVPPKCEIIVAVATLMHGGDVMYFGLLPFWEIIT